MDKLRGHEGPNSTEREPPPRVSAETFSIPLQDGRYVIYAPLRRAAYVGNASAINILADIHDGSYHRTSDPDGGMLELLRALEIVDGGPETQPITEFRGAPEPTAVTLFLTTSCNLRCTYCYASAGDKPARSMPIDVARHGIDFVIANAVRQGVPRVEIAYHGGGEPTVNWKTLTGSLDYARARASAQGIAVHASLATNGVLSDARIDWIIANISDVSLSFDGEPEVHDRHRPTVGGHGSSARVIHTLERLDAVDFPYGLRMTVTADQIARLPDSVAFVCERFRPGRILVEPSYQLGRWKEAPSAETAAFIAAYREAQARARELGREIQFSGARLGLLTNHFCGISQDSFSLSPDGNVSACYEAFSEDQPLASTFFYGKPEGEAYAFNLPVLDHLRGQAVQHRGHCQGCFAKWSCGGDCYHRAKHADPATEFAGTDRCHIIRELTKDQILDRIAAAGGWFWHEPPPATPVEIGE